MIVCFCYHQCLRFHILIVKKKDLNQRGHTLHQFHFWRSPYAYAQPYHRFSFSGSTSRYTRPWENGWAVPNPGYILIVWSCRLLTIEGLKTGENGERNLGKQPKLADIICQCPLSIPNPEVFIFRPEMICGRMPMPLSMYQGQQKYQKYRKNQHFILS